MCGLNRYEVLRVRSRDELTIERLEAFGADYVFFPHWSWRIPASVFERFECVIFHMTDVPFGRGGSPLQNLVIRGIENTVLTALRCSQEVDAGPVYLKLPLSTLGTAEEVFIRASFLMLPMMIRIVDERIEPYAQSGEPTFFRRRTPEQGNLQSMSSLTDLHDFIRMLDADGYPHAFLDVGVFRLRFRRSSLSPNSVKADVVFTYLNQEDQN
ncbi:methionyl-tRNA formyltransferase [Acidovorax sp. HMWF018]|nr:methionyl-tRNA formyltransferase [Burkholderiales bacterium]PTT40624.1 methionyl-tRNA formyltransferase [Acidovorax sp. HMWF018]